MDRPPFFVELASDDVRLESMGARRTRGILRLLEEEIDPLRSLLANPRAVSDIDYSIRSDPKTQEHFPDGSDKPRIWASVLYERGLHETPCSRNIAGAGGSASIAGKIIIRASAQISSWYARGSEARRHRHGFQQALEDEFSGRGRHDDHVAVVQWRVRRLSCSYRVDVVFRTGA